MVQGVLRTFKLAWPQSWPPCHFYLYPQSAVCQCMWCLWSGLSHWNGRTKDKKCKLTTQAGSAHGHTCFTLERFLSTENNPQCAPMYSRLVQCCNGGGRVHLGEFIWRIKDPDKELCDTFLQGQSPIWRLRVFNQDLHLWTRVVRVLFKCVLYRLPFIHINAWAYIIANIKLIN